MAQRTDMKSALPLWVLLFALGCGQVSFEELDVRDAGEQDAPADTAQPVDARRLIDAPGSDVPDGGFTDAPVDTPADSVSDVARDVGAPDSGVTCVWTGPPNLGDVVSLDALNTPGLETDPSLTPDLLTLYFASDVAGTSDVYRATRTDVMAAFSDPEPVAGLADPNHGESQVSFVDASLLMGVHASGRGGGLGGSDLYLVSRPAIDAAFDRFTAIPGMNSPGNEFDPIIDSATGDLYFASDRDGSLDIYRAPSLGAGWAAPEQVAGLNGGTNDSALAFAPGSEHALFQSGNDVFYGLTMSRRSQES